MRDDRIAFKQTLEDLQAKLSGDTRGDPALLQQARKTVVECHKNFIFLSCFSAVPGHLTPEYEAQLREDFELARETLELGVLLAVQEESDSVFDREYKELFGIYFNSFVLRNLTVSKRQALVMAIGMLWHLARDDLEQFHLVLHRVNGVGRNGVNKNCSATFSFFGVPIDQLPEHDRRLLQFPMELERHIMDGNVARVMTAISTSLPDPNFAWSVRLLLNTLRNRQALALEAAYERMPVGHAMEQLAFRDPQDLFQFIEKDRRMKEHQLATLAASKADDLVFAAKWIPNDTPSNLPERPSTPNALPRAGEGKVFANLARTASSGGPTRTFSLKKQESHHQSSENYRDSERVEPISEVLGRPVAGRKLEGTGLVTENQKQGNKIWLLTPDREYIFFREMVKPRPLIPAQDLLRQFLTYAVDMEAVV